MLTPHTTIINVGLVFMSTFMVYEIGPRIIMKGFVAVVCLLSAATGYVASHNRERGLGGSGRGGGGRFGGGGLGGGPISRDVHEQETVVGSTIVDEINQLLLHANKSITANELLASGNKLKSLSQAWLDAHQVEVFNGDVNNYINKIISGFSHVTAFDLITTDALGEEAKRVTLILQLLKICADEIQRSEDKGEDDTHIVRAVSLLADKLITATENSVDLYKVTVYNSEAKKRDLNRRQGTWSTELLPGLNSFGEKLTYENGPFKAFGVATQGYKGGEQYEGGLTYSKGPWVVGGGVTYNPNSGANGGINFGYTKDNLKIGGTYDYNPQTGSSFGIGGTWRFKK